jgi:uncharacterized protein involved in outer membrane biogenesis
VKKFIIGLVVFLGVLVAAAAAVPLFVDVDQYRPKIEAAANEKLNGKLELGKLSLSLWGQVRIEIEGLKIKDVQGKNVVFVQDAYFHLPFSSVFSGSPQLVLMMNKPVLSVTQGRDGKLNILSLVKSEQPQAQAQGATPPAQTGGSENVKLPGIVARSRLGLELKSASLAYVDDTTGLKTQIDDLNFIVHDLSLSRQTEMELTADLHTSIRSTTEPHNVTMTVTGPIRLDAKAKPTINSGKFDHLDLLAELNLDNLDIEMPGVFHKSKGIDAHAAVSMTASEKQAKIEQLTVKFSNAEIQGSGTISKPADTAIVDVSLKSNTIDFKPWAEMVPALKSYELGGSTQFDAQANGPSDKLKYQAHLKVNALTAKAPELKEQPKIDGAIDIATDRIENLNLRMEAPDNNLVIRGHVNSFTTPQADFSVTSQKLDLDRLIAFPQENVAAEKPADQKSKAEGEKTRTDESGPSNDNDAAVAKLRDNKMLELATLNLNWNLKMIKAKGVEIDDLDGRMSVKDLVAKLESMSMKVFGGNIRSTATVQLKSHVPSYQFTGSADQVDLAQAVASQMHLFKNTVTGKAYFNISGQGASFNTKPAMENLNAKGKMEIKQATFASIDVGKMVSQGLLSSLDKIPGMAGKGLTPPSISSKYDTISSNFTISNGKFNAPDFVAKALPNQGIDLKGTVEAGLVDQSLKADITVIDTYNLTKAPRLLAEGNGPVKFPISVGCTLSAPCYNYGQVAAYLTKIAAGNAVKGQAAGLLKKNAPPGVQNQLNQGLKKLFGG